MPPKIHILSAIATSLLARSPKALRRPSPKELTIYDRIISEVAAKFRLT